MRDIIIPVSGGKDSQVCTALAVDKYGPDRCAMAHQHTGFDHPLTYAHMEYMADLYKVPLLHIHSDKYKSVPEVLLGEKLIPHRLTRTCTRTLKTEPWFKWLRKQPGKESMLVLLGMRSAESPDRRQRYRHIVDTDIYTMREVSSKAPKAVAGVHCQLPILSWSTPAVFSFLRSRGDRVNPLYAMGHRRVGCFPCVLAGPPTFRLAARDPVGREHLKQLQHAIIKIQEERPSAYFEHDLAKLLDTAEQDPFGFMDQEDEQAGGCSWCNL